MILNTSTQPSPPFEGNNPMCSRFHRPARFCVRRTTHSLALAALFALATASPAVAGPVILGGDDLTDHGSRSGTVLSDGWLYIQKALENLAPAVTRPRNDGSVAVLGSADNSTATSGNAGAAYHFAVPNAAATTSLTGTVSFHDGATAINTFFANLAIGAVNPAIIVTAGTGANNNLDSNEGTALANNALGIANFVNSGGGLLSHGSGSTAYGWLTALIPGVSFPSGCSSSTLTLTVAGQLAFPGLTNANIQSGPCHNNFQNHGLTVLAMDGSNREIIIGGAAVILPGQITLTPLVDFNPPGTDHTVTALVVDQAANPLSDITVTFLVTAGPNAGATGMAVTDASGNASFTYTSNGTIGLDTIEASFVEPPVPQIAKGGGGTPPVVTTALKFWDLDCQANGIPDTCDLDCAGFGGACAPNFVDCGGSADCNDNGIPDTCEPDCDNNGVPDDCELNAETDTNSDGLLDVCDPCLNPGDTTPPVFTGCPQSISGSLDANCNFPAPDLQVDATDNCTAAADLVITTNPADLTTLAVGENPVTVTVTDKAGNFTECTVMVNIDIGDCDLGGDTPPPQPAPCDPSTGGFNFLLSLFFHAPVCGMGCPLMMMLTICGMLSLKARTRRRWPK